MARSERVRSTAPELGETWGDGTLVLAWDAALFDASKVGSERNVVLHEFVHGRRVRASANAREPACALGADRSAARCVARLSSKRVTSAW